MAIPYIKQGELVVLTHGEYSDYGFSAVVRALQDFDVTQLLDLWKAAKGLVYLHGEWCLNGKEISQWDREFPDFDAWLINESGLVEEIPYREIHVGSYSDIDPEVVG